MVAFCNKLFAAFCDNTQFVKTSVTFHSKLNPLSANPTKWSNTLKKFAAAFADE